MTRRMISWYASSTPPRSRAEAILVQLLAGGLIPQAAGVGRDLVSQNDLAVRSLTELQLEVTRVTFR